MASLRVVSALLLLSSLLIVETRIIGRRLRHFEQCSTPGYFGDAEDCRKFYRCAEHPTEDENRPLLIRYTFRCPNGTVFDEALSTCNHPEAVPNKPEPCQPYDPPAPEESDGGSGNEQGNDNSWIYGHSGYNNHLISQQPQTVFVPINQLLYPSLNGQYGNVIHYGK